MSISAIVHAVSNGLEIRLHDHRWPAAMVSFAVLVVFGFALTGTVFFDPQPAKPKVSAAVPPGLSAALRNMLSPAPGMGALVENAATAKLPRLRDLADLDTLDLGALRKRPMRKTMRMAVKSGDTLSGVLARAGVTAVEADKAVRVMASKLDPRKIRVGQMIEVTVEPPAPDLVAASATGQVTKKSPKLMRLAIKTDVDRHVSVKRLPEDEEFQVTEIVTELEEKFLRAAAKIESSLFQAPDAAGIPRSITIELMRMYAYDVDFQREIQKGDSFEVFYTRYFDDEGEAVKDGSIHFGALVLDGSPRKYYRFTTPDDQVTDYYDEEGKSAKKFLMKTPVDGARLSSSFGKRKHPILGYTKMHKGVDFAAPRGTPIMAAGNGVVERASRFGGFGKYIRIRHANGYKTAYAHLNGYASGVKKGARVRQGQVIGYVGTTGRSTGPHLHYEVHMNNKVVNPMTIRVPTGRKLDGEILKAFNDMRSATEAQMAALPANGRLTTAQLETSGTTSR